ncbi:C-type lectin domain family 14 member A [Tenrec ecaudatus]|uniref:C-type lectin domain family 14 member A n=1 Tax=Tenrec ecaudatus TaxID=94439 RepID=UPI003F5A759C
MRPAFALCLLWQALGPGLGRAEHPTADRAGCSASGACYSLHHATIQRLAAEEACSLRGGVLSPVSGGAELDAVRALLRAGPGPGGGSRALLFWVALERKKSSCTQASEPLRGFTWPPLDSGEPPAPAAGETLPWVEEPLRSCTVRRCAGLQAAGGVEPAGWKETRCHLRADGYLCKYQFQALCPAPRPGAASDWSYRAPFQLHSAALAFSPPGTEVSALCPGPLSVSAKCVAEEAGAHWEGLPSGDLLCPCPGRYLLAGRCAELSNCLDDSGGFTCECAAGFEVSQDGHSCVTTREGQPTPGEMQVVTEPTQVTAASQGSNTGPPTSHEKSGEIPLGSVPGSSEKSTPEIPEWEGRATTSTLPMPTRTNSQDPIPTSGSASPKFNSTSASTVGRTFDSSSMVVFILVGIAVIVLVILTLTVLGIFKFCFHKDPSSNPRKGPLTMPGADSETEGAALRSSPSHCAANGGKVGVCSLGEGPEGLSLVESSLGPEEV